MYSPFCYNGYTVDLTKRLRQHNNVIKGGARATSNRGPWNFLIVITSPCWDSISTAMQHEWSIKYPTRRRPRPREYNGKLGRLQSLIHVFEHMKKLNCDNIQCYVHNDYIPFMTDMVKEFEFVSIKELETLIIKKVEKN
jgi:predicted GIY-YIG superfamily endonuclease